MTDETLPIQFLAQLRPLLTHSSGRQLRTDTYTHRYHCGNQITKEVTMKLATLHRRAASTAKWRGHHIRWDKPKLDKMQYGWCDKCGKIVVLLTNPSPNQIEIGGAAMAVNCVGDK